jgi:hypothetical protein
MSRRNIDDYRPAIRAQIRAQLGRAEDRGPVSHAQPEPDKAPALDGAISGKAFRLRRVTVRFTGYRVHPLDPDNFAGSVKDLLDGCRHAGLISGDEWWRIRLETEQVKVDHYAEEKTVVEIIP